MNVGDTDGNCCFDLLVRNSGSGMKHKRNIFRNRLADRPYPFNIKRRLVKGNAVELRPTMRAADWNAVFECQVQQVLADAADPEREPGAYVESGVTYYNPQRAAEMARARAVLDELLE